MEEKCCLEMEKEILSESPDQRIDLYRHLFISNPRMRATEFPESCSIYRLSRSGTRGRGECFLLLVIYCSYQIFDRSGYI